MTVIIDCFALFTSKKYASFAINSINDTVCLLNAFAVSNVTTKNIAK